MGDRNEIDAVLGVLICKNLFLCNRQKTNFYLLMMPGDGVKMKRETEMNNDEMEEKLGYTIAGIAWVAFAVRFLLIATLIFLLVFYILGKPLWIAPVTALVLFILYRLFWRLIWRFIEWASKQR